MWLKFRSYNVPAKNYIKLRTYLKKAGDEYLSEVGLKNLTVPKSPAPIRAVVENIFSNYKDRSCDSAFIMLIQPKQGKHIPYDVCQVRKSGIVNVKKVLTLIEGVYVNEDTKDQWNIGRFDLFNKFSEIEKRDQPQSDKQMDLIYLEKHNPTFLQTSISGVHKLGIRI